MKVSTKIAITAVAMLVVLVGTTWWEAMPATPRPDDFAEGSLGRAVRQACDPDRRGTFKDQDFRDAVTCRDLAAQESMALSTSRLVWLSWLQVFVAVGGAGAVVWTVMIAIESMKVTQRQLLHQQNVSRAELRPKITREARPVIIDQDGRALLHLSFLNRGQTTALNLRRGLLWKVVPGTDGKSALDADALRLRKPKSVLTVETPTGWEIYLSPSATARILAGTHCLQAAVCGVYDDALGGAYRFQFCKVFYGTTLARERGLEGFKFTDPDLKNREF